MLNDLALMTVHAYFALVGNVLVHTGPHKLIGDSHESGLFSKMGETSGASTCCISQ